MTDPIFRGSVVGSRITHLVWVVGVTMMSRITWRGLVELPRPWLCIVLYLVNHVCFEKNGPSASQGERVVLMIILWLQWLLVWGWCTCMTGVERWWLLTLAVIVTPIADLCGFCLVNTYHYRSFAPMLFLSSSIFEKGRNAIRPKNIPPKLRYLLCVSPTTTIIAILRRSKIGQSDCWMMNIRGNFSPVWKGISPFQNGHSYWIWSKNTWLIHWLICQLKTLNNW